MSSQHIDLGLWMDKTIIDRQQQLKAQFIEILEEIGNSFSNEELKTAHPSSKGKKISKGNDLLGYPYFVLDLVRDFNPDSGMNFRILNWFGHGFFLLVFFGKDVQIPVEPMIKTGFEFGLTDDPWDFGKIILAKDTTSDKQHILTRINQFQIWIKEIALFSDKNLLKNEIQEEIKNVIHLTLTSSVN